jgi:hypothetical protein
MVSVNTFGLVNTFVRSIGCRDCGDMVAHIQGAIMITLRRIADLVRGALGVALFTTPCYAVAAEAAGA